MGIKEAFCPECSSRLKLGNHPRQGQRVVCSSCETNLIITNVNPLELDSLTTGGRANRPKKKNRAVEATCPECDASIKLKPHTPAGYRFSCHKCHIPLEVISTNPLEVDVAFTANVKYNSRYNLDE